MIVKTIKNAAFGFILGMAVGNFIAALTGAEMLVAPSLVKRIGSWQAAVLVQTLLSGVIGAAGMGGMSFYDIERWSLLRTALTHYALCIAVCLPVALFLSWIDNLVDFLVIITMMGIGYMIIFFIMYAYYKKQVKELNELQKEYLKNQKKIGGTL